MKIPSPSRLAPTSHNSGKQASTFIIKIFTPPHKFEFDGPTIKIIKENTNINQSFSNAGSKNSTIRFR